MNEKYYKKECKNCEHYSEEEISYVYDDDEDEFLLHCKKPFCVVETENRETKNSPNKNPNILDNPWFVNRP